ncbi:MAG: cob(I)yrinic acid a,c-diamide adenosyltransferase [Planctomycetaceae bacterium]|nr:cob(I)yrinic acid a,c-diamide adenosyltransferase [Planctomycetaceae bacterium]
MKIYTRTGDEGETGLYGGPRVRKDDPRIEAYGTVDELNALLGVARAETLPAEVDELLARLQNELFDLGGELASPDPDARQTRFVTAERIAALESSIDHFEAGLAPPKQFILPGGVRGAALVHQARTVCRRAERRLITLARDPQAAVSLLAVVYLNRLSDLLFVVARSINAEAGQGDVPWVKQK